MQQEGFVLAAIRGRYVVTGFAYYGGDGEWTTEDNAEVYFTRKAMRSAMKEAHEAGMPGDAMGITAFGVVVGAL